MEIIYKREETMRVIDLIRDKLSAKNKFSDGVVEISGIKLKERIIYYSKIIYFCKDCNRVAFAANNNIYTLTLMLSAMMAGKTFCPIHTGLDKEKIERIAEETGALFLYSDFNPDNGIRECFSKKLSLDDDYDYSNNTIEFRDCHDADSEVYVIYTSGTEGKIKGCVISNSNLLNYCNSIIETIGITGRDKSIITTSFAFDLAYSGIFPVLLSGGSIYIFPKHLPIEKNLINYIAENKITLMKTTPGIIRMMVKSPNIGELKSLKKIISGGERFDYAICRDLHILLNNCKIFNHYGPTEATIGCCIGLVDFRREENEAAAIYPISNVEIHLENENGIVKKSSEIGELFIKGLCLGKYVSCKADEQIGTVYPTGDLAYYTDDGGLIIVGRKDSVLKVNGYRINIKNITETILKQFYIEDATCIYDKTNKGIICFYVSYMDPMNVKAKLSNILSNYELPSVFFSCKEIPRTGNGKIDSTKLLDMYRERFSSNSDVLINRISQTVGLDFESIKNERIDNYLSSIEMIGLLVDLTDSVGHSFFDSSFTINTFGDLLTYARMNKENDDKKPLKNGDIFILSGGSERLQTNYYEAENLNKILSEFYIEDNKKVLIYTLHSTTPVEYGNIVKSIFDKYGYESIVFDSELMLNEEFFINTIRWAKCIYIGGGDYIRLYNQFQQYDIGSYIKKYSKEKIMMGVCAGAGILCEKFYADVDENMFSLMDGYNVLNIIMTPHFSSEPYKSLEFLKELKRKNLKNALAIEDGAVVCVDDEKKYSVLAADGTNGAYMFSSTDGVLKKRTLKDKGRLYN
ncbi:MAG: AMP-binding protein [Pseudobutyrivibrio sp.]|uniref:AMP-binding protein n=1 Tax=Pseudobutyrivibrio sp. TaxID=2014367 RepID=UPI0025D93B09|nr:AMP-binding protein [Pseudobutyrivibrio sp.]MBQ8490092.1 AMP-binding protein [Pseudobutyrivibrio sp.]